ncbi:RNA helicase CrhR [Vibrio stylophorae]|uniref:RNA helicase CrhR n=1 Tax=Vibrio stylophorae TaxID=659351 RepID=A0ABM8ZY58_9VIBR|nr:DEAD/DEAH box helicase [Vibrio stylophorae]CAH0535192.1 RNA helicase CrhR [Vibrio stylophorae]
MQFRDLDIDNRLLKPIHHFGFNRTTEIQTKAIPVAAAGRDVMASSKTGSGKTLAYLLPALHRLIRYKPLSRQDARMVILTPTRELAKQVYGQLKQLTASLRFESVLVVGGENFNDQARLFQRNPSIIVGTPGRIADHLEHRHLFLQGLELLIFDEADRMLDMGFAKQLRAINSAANHRKRQTMMFSATMDSAEVNELAHEFLNEPVRIAVGSGHEQHQDIVQSFYLCDHLDHKQAILQRLLEQADYRQVIIFTATRQDTDRLAKLLNEWGHKAVGLSGELSQTARNQIMSQFERVVYKILVTTDIASRGLDLENVSHVVNFDMPKHAEEYVHRVGRTGRAGAKGEAFSLVGPKDWFSFKAVESFLQQTITFSVLDGLKGRFKGLKPKSKKVVKKAAPKANKDANKRSTKPQAKNYDKRFYQTQDVGDMPFMVKKKTPLVDDEGEEA